MLHNIRNAPDFQKGELAEKFAEQFYNNPQQFVDFLRQDSIRVDDDYKETGEFIQQGRNTLHRHCNFHLAWLGTKVNSNRMDMYLQNTNVKQALDAVYVAKALGCKVYVGAGS